MEFSEDWRILAGMGCNKSLNRKCIFYIIVVLVSFVLAGIADSKTAQASSASVSVNSENTSVVKGDVVYVVITVSSADEIGGFKGYFSYDNSVLKYVTGGNVTSGNDNEFLISDTDREKGARKIKYSVKFVARASGSTSIGLKQPYSVYSYTDSSEMSVSYSPLNILVKNKKADGTTKEPGSTKKPAGAGSGGTVTQSPAPEETLEPKETLAPSAAPAIPARLRSLKIKDISLSPSFSPDILKYSGIVYTDRQSLDISYETEDPDSEVTIPPPPPPPPRKNIIKIVVKNPMGGKTVYKLSVKVQEEVSYVNGGNVQAKLRDGKVVLNTSDEYTVIELQDKELIPEGFGQTEMKLGERLVTVYASENDTEHKFVLLYCKRGKASPEFYLYDKEEQTLMPYPKVQAWYRGNSGNAVVTGGAEESTEVQKFKYMLAIVVIICLLLIIIIISVYMHFKGMNKDDLSEILKKE